LVTPNQCVAWHGDDAVAVLCLQVSLGDDGDVDVVAGQIGTKILGRMRLAERRGVQHVQ